MDPSPRAGLLNPGIPPATSSLDAAPGCDPMTDSAPQSSLAAVPAPVRLAPPRTSLRARIRVYAAIGLLVLGAWLYVAVLNKSVLVVSTATGRVRAVIRVGPLPDALAITPDGRTLYVSNLTLYLPYAGANAAIDSDWALQVKGYTVSAIPASIPPVSSGSDNNNAQ